MCQATGASCSTGRVPKPRRDARGVKDDPKRRHGCQESGWSRRRGTANQRPRRVVPRFLCKIGVSIFLDFDDDHNLPQRPRTAAQPAVCQPPDIDGDGTPKDRGTGGSGRQRRRVGGGSGGGECADHVALIDATTSTVSHGHPHLAVEIKLTPSKDPIHSIPTQS
ncbi:hypothetical protein DFP72DRAFT_907218 [Ephemerocybe angulata]|uniref:Uncharacterized protein n=1 Tax=Ephemerocybe angulata TaxID=980116 RepID=A0A8H6HQT2_9AGAR|nr:hypothetical protein DFP72DRAFT_907192 [Tulosesus angulatus]KAF6751483.1 hypothetical protein DFP72DRAFT_907218 [Tulosesus angulatus]